MPIPLKPAALTAMLAVLFAAIACGSAQPAAIPAATSTPPPAGAPATPGPPTDNPSLRDLSPDQREELDQQIANLSEIVRILAECAAEAGETVPAPGATDEANWYARAAITHSACAATKGTGIDFTGGN